MQNKNPESTSITTRENFILNWLNKAISEFKAIRALMHKTKPYKILSIAELSSIPGESIFTIQLSNKNIIITQSAADLLAPANHYNLNDFSNYHADMIRQAGLGKLEEFIRLPKNKNSHKIISKTFDRESKKHIFTIETSNGELLRRSTKEISNEATILNNLPVNDIYDIGYSQCGESMIQEEKDISSLTTRS